MTPEEYKKFCSKVSAFRVSELDDTLALLRQRGGQEASVVALALSQGRVEKPAKYAGNLANDFCLVTCTLEEASSIAELLLEAEASAVSRAGETTAAASRYADLANKWFSFRESLQ